jgi:pyridoxine kinase
VPAFPPKPALSPPAAAAILSVQSSVAYGHVGNAAAVFCLRRSGFDVWPVDTVAFSNHPGYGRHAGRIRPATEVGEIIEGLRSIGALKRCGGLLSGYIGSADTGRVIHEAARDLKAQRPSALWCCDPVMGDHGPGVYVPRDIVDFFRKIAVPAADILVPNSFELELLTGLRTDTIRSAIAAAAELLRQGPQAVVVTSVNAEVNAGVKGAGRDTISSLAVTRQGSWLVTTPRLPLAAKGAGDVLAALLFARLLSQESVPEALAAAVSSIFAVIEVTARAGSEELRLVAAQDALVAPSRRFMAEPVG